MMTRNEYLSKLKSYLSSLREGELREILLDYEEHFNIGRDKGKTDDEISSELGSPREVADSILSTLKTDGNNKSATSQERTSNDSTRRFLVFLLLLGLNIVFVLGPVVAIMGMIVGIFGAGIGFVVGGIGLVFGAPFASFVSGFVPGILTSISFGIGLSALGALVFILGIVVSKLFYRIMSMYIEWNRRIING
ncbi:DUF1700 domain-containing protein [Gudongella sp. SC589]|jgi:uncharacterized membrane protein|uniref:DUF1700 domain-containing protein n=1 Tax=Gudongella sp. SC589 TaxID=3385990 RepID=UPI003904A457